MRNEVCDFQADFPRPSIDEFRRAAFGLRKVLSMHDRRIKLGIVLLSEWVR